MKLSSIEIDYDLSTLGTWFNYSGDFYIRIARAGSKLYKESITKQFGKGLTNDDMHRTALANLVTDWKGLIGEDDKEIEFTLDHINTTILNPNYPELMDFVIIKSADIENYRVQKVEEIKKHSVAM